MKNQSSQSSSKSEVHIIRNENRNEEDSDISSEFSSDLTLDISSSSYDNIKKLTMVNWNNFNRDSALSLQSANYNNYSNFPIYTMGKNDIIQRTNELKMRSKLYKEIVSENVKVPKKAPNKKCPTVSCCGLSSFFKRKSKKKINAHNHSSINIKNASGSSDSNEYNIDNLSKNTTVYF